LPENIHSRLRVVLVRPRNPLNIGAAARAMSNFGFASLRVVNPYDVAFREARSAVGASRVLAGAEEFTSITDAVADCGLVVGTTAVGRREIQHPLRRPEEAAAIINSQTSRVALLFGSEKVGLSNRDLSHCHWLLRIPTSESNISMNLGQAVAVCLYELIREERSIPEPLHEDSADGQHLERISGLLTEALLFAGYTSSEGRAATEEKVRRLVHRLNLSSADAELLLGMLRHIEHDKSR
jgi:tRNA/rRNA methyltransferase